MNILFVHELDWLNVVVYELHSLSELLCRSGHRVYAIDYESKWGKHSTMGIGTLKTRVFDGIGRAYPDASVTLRRPGFIRIPGLSRLTAFLTHYWEIQRTIRDKAIEVIVLYSVPTNGLQTVYLARKFGIPVIFRSIDVLNQLVPYPVLRPITHLLERKVYSSVDLILTLTPRLSQYVINMGASETRVKLLPPGVETGLFHPGVDCTDIRQKWDINEQDKVILFIGTLFEFSGLDAFISRFREVIREIPEAKLLIVGDGPQRLRLEKIIAELGLKKQVSITGYQPYQDMPRYINLAAVCINPFLVNKTTRDIIPTKVLQYLACGKGVVCTPLPGTKALLPPVSSGMIYASDIDEIIDKVIHLLKSPRYRQQLGQAALNYIKAAHSYDKIGHELEAILQNVKDRRI